LLLLEQRDENRGVPKTEMWKAKNEHRTPDIGSKIFIENWPNNGNSIENKNTLTKQYNNSI